MGIVHLAEVIPFKYNIVEKRGETKRPGVIMVLEGTFQHADLKNANSRMYPKSLWQGIMKDDDINTRLETRRMLGELDHPSSGATSLNRASHVITEHALLSDNKVFGRLDILETPSGKIAATLLEAGVQVGISSRGDGSVEKKGDMDEVQSDYRLETYDLVLKPSTPGAYPQIIENEEEAAQNVDLIASAVEGLVKSTDNIDVLLECHKIISVLEGCEARRESTLAEIKAKLGNGKGEETTITLTSEETDMSAKDITAPSTTIELSSEMKDYLKEWVDKGVAEAVEVKDMAISELNERIVKLTSVNEELQETNTAAEGLVDELSERITSLSENQETDSVLAERHEAAMNLLDESVSRLQEMGDTQRRLAATEELLAESLIYHQDEALAEYAEEQIADLDEDKQDAMRPMLYECLSTDDIDTKYESLTALMGESAPTHDPNEREPLPTFNRDLNEAVNESEYTNDQSVSDYTITRLVDRCS